LRIGFVGSAMFRMLPSLVALFRSRHPGVELVLTESTSGRILRMIKEKSLDIGLVRTPLLHVSDLLLFTLQRDHFALALPHSHRLVAERDVSLALMEDESFVMYSAEEAAGLHAAV